MGAFSWSCVPHKYPPSMAKRQRVRLFALFERSQYSSNLGSSGDRARVKLPGCKAADRMVDKDEGIIGDAAYRADGFDSRLKGFGANDGRREATRF